MSYYWMTALSLCLLVAVPGTGAADDGSGELSIPSVSPMQPDQLDALRQLASSDPEAGALAARLAREAAPAVGSDPQPLAVIAATP